MGLCQPVRCGCAIQSRSVRLQGDGTTDNPYDLDTWYHIAPPSTRYLTPAVGTAWTPDPGIGIPAGGVTICAKVRKTVLDTATFAPIAIQGETSGQYSWQLYIIDGYMAWLISNNGTNAYYALVLSDVELAAVMESEEDIELAATLRATGTNIEARGHHRPTGGSWTTAGALNTTAFTGTIYDSYAHVRIGQDSTDIWDGRIYHAEMRTGLDPAAGTVIWRFDAEEHPGAGTAYTDPRGRDWYLDTAAVTPLPVEAVHGMQAYLPGPNRIVRHDGNTWRTELAPLNPYTPVYTGISLGTGATNLGAYTITDEVITVQGHLVLGTGGSVTTVGIAATLPAGLYPVFVADAPSLRPGRHPPSRLRRLLRRLHRPDPHRLRRHQHRRPHRRLLLLQHPRHVQPVTDQPVHLDHQRRTGVESHLRPGPPDHPGHPTHPEDDGPLGPRPLGSQHLGLTVDPAHEQRPQWAHATPHRRHRHRRHLGMGQRRRRRPEHPHQPDRQPVQLARLHQRRPRRQSGRQQHQLLQRRPVHPQHRPRPAATPASTRRGSTSAPTPDGCGSTTTKARRRRRASPSPSAVPVTSSGNGSSSSASTPPRSARSPWPAPAASPYNYTSDPRLKTPKPAARGGDSDGIGDAAERVQQLGAQAWVGQWVDTHSGEAVGGDWDFLSSHDIEDVAPYAVTGERDAVAGPPQNEGEPEEGSPVYQQVNYPALVPLLTAALSQALDRIAELTTRIEALETA